MSSDAAGSIVQAFIHSSLDYCNALLNGITDTLLKRLQSVQNAAARLIAGARPIEHIISVLNRHLWLPVCQRVSYKLAVLVYRSLDGSAPSSLAGDCHLIADSGRRSLRSADSRKLVVPGTHSHFGDRSFGAFGPHISNALCTKTVLTYLLGLLTMISDCVKRHQLLSKFSRLFETVSTQSGGTIVKSNKYYDEDNSGMRIRCHHNLNLFIQIWQTFQHDLLKLGQRYRVVNSARCN
jgi:hypothetical protein